MEQLVLAVKMLREEYKFRGYIHLKSHTGSGLWAYRLCLGVRGQNELEH